MDALRADLMASELCTSVFTDLDMMVSYYNSTPSSLRDKYAPLRTKSVANRKRVPWFDHKIKDAIKARRRAERKWRYSKSAQDLSVFKKKKNHAIYLMNQARCDYYTNHIQQNSSDQRKLFNVTKSLLCDTYTASFPRIDNVRLANDFGNFFAQKIEDINASLANSSTSSVPSLPATDITCLKERFTGFKTLSQEQVRLLISKAAGKSCQLDPIPNPIVLKLLDVLLPVITKLINLSFDTSRFAEAWKEALVLPSLKKPGLDSAFKIFRPVSNLSYISKLSERAGVEQFMEHLTANDLHSQLQSAYKQRHSTETALLKVKNDILMSMDEQHVTLLVLLDLSAAFDTIHHDKLIDRLESDLGITDNALA